MVRRDGRRTQRSSRVRARSPVALRARAPADFDRVVRQVDRAGERAQVDCAIARAACAGIVATASEPASRYGSAAKCVVDAATRRLWPSVASASSTIPITPPDDTSRWSRRRKSASVRAASGWRPGRPGTRSRPSRPRAGWLRSPRSRPTRSRGRRRVAAARRRRCRCASAGRSAGCRRLPARRRRSARGRARSRSRPTARSRSCGRCGRHRRPRSRGFRDSGRARRTGSASARPRAASARPAAGAHEQRIGIDHAQPRERRAHRRLREAEPQRARLAPPSSYSASNTFSRFRSRPAISSAFMTLIVLSI